MNLLRCTIPALLAVICWTSLCAADSPHIVYVICDDLGYGDVHCLNPTHAKIPTPNIDQLASEGMVFTDAHSGSSVCTPTRYGVMTGRYSWRTRLQSGVVQGFAPSLIAPQRMTVAGLAKQQGYATVAFGKWHLDFQYCDPETGKFYPKQDKKKLPPIGARIPDGPVDRGFDHYHGFHHSAHMQAVIEDDRVIVYDEVINMLPRLQSKTVEYLHSRSDADQPFFLYLPLSSPHEPIVPLPEWQRKSGLGPYGDFVMQTDHVLGEVCKTLEELGMSDNTLIIFTSDNGCSKAAGIQDLAKQGHLVSANFRGSKADIWDGGHRIPFIVRWPGVVEPGSHCDQLICLTDLFATVAAILGTEVPAGTREDSVSFLPALSGDPIVSTRSGVIHHSISGHFAYRTGKWKLILARGSGGWTSPREDQVPSDAPEAQLYDMESDSAEQHNLYTEKPEVAQRLLELLKTDVYRGRSTDGPRASNDTNDVVLWKSPRTAEEKGNSGQE